MSENGEGVSGHTVTLNWNVYDDEYVVTCTAEDCIWFATTKSARRAERLAEAHNRRGVAWSN